MKSRLAIIGIWLLGLILSLIILESYIHTTTEDGLNFLLPEDRLPSMTPLVTIFGTYLGGILSFWFLKPFKPIKSDHAEIFRFWLAIICTLLFVGVILYFVSYTYIYFPNDTTVIDNITTGSKVAALLSFVVAPVNFYYFGMKSNDGGSSSV